MPYAIWCTGCPRETLIPQGVRFNAEKKRVGTYLTSPIFAFRMRHTACGTTIEIRTDPKNTAYIVTEGARKKDTGEDRATEGLAVQFRTEEERERLRNDAFAALEVKVDDRTQAKTESARIAELLRASERAWDDPYAANQALRRSFRVGRKAREVQTGKDVALQDRMGLGMQIAEETAEDRRRAKQVEFGTGVDDEKDALRRAQARGMFAKEPRSQGVTVSATSSRDSLHQVLSSNTRAAVDPFAAQESGSASSKTIIPGVKRKRRQNSSSDDATARQGARPNASLVNDDYDSD